MRTHISNKHNKLWLFLSLGVSAIILVILLSTSLVKSYSEQFIYSEPETIPHAQVGLIFGTSKYRSHGGHNLFFDYRMNAGAELFKAGKINYILVSGDNRTDNYNEPVMMRDALVELGVPSDRIVLDFAGLRTFDSVVRAKKVFGCNDLIFISQNFQIERALYIAQHFNMTAIGYAAKDVPDKYGVKTHLREYLARVKTMLDLHVLNTEPKHLGPQIVIGEGE